MSSKKNGEGGGSGGAGRVRHVRGERQTRIYECLRKEILTLELRPGTPLDETRMAKSFATSRAPVREALIRLSADGLVDILPNRSTLVAPLDMLLIPKYLDALCLLQRTTHRMAAVQRNAGQLEKIQSAQDHFFRMLGQDDPSGAIEANHGFHLCISEASGNPYFVAAYRRILNEGMRIQHMHLEYTGWDKDDAGIKEHEALVQAIKEKDEERAEQVARSHAEQFDRQFFRFLNKRLSDRIDLGAPDIPERNTE